MRVSITFTPAFCYAACAAVALLLGACDQNAHNQAQKSTKKTDYQALFTNISEKLEKNPADAVLNAQNIIARIGLCIEEDCFSQPQGETSFKMLVTPIQNSLTLLKGEEEQVQETYPYTAELSKALTLLEALPAPLEAHQKLLQLQTTESFYNAVEESLFATLQNLLYQAFTSADNAEFIRQMQNLSATKTLNTAPQAFIEFLTGLISNNTPLILSKTQAVRNQGGDHIPTTAWATLPPAYLFYQTQQPPSTQAGQRFINDFSTFLTERKWEDSTLTTQARQAMATGLENLLEHQETTNLLLANQPQQPPVEEVVNTSPISAAPMPQMETESLATSATTAAKQEAEKTIQVPTRLTLYLQRMKLELMGKNAPEATWETFLKDAAVFIREAEDPNLIFPPLNMDMVPENQQGRYRNALFTALEVANEQKADISVLLALFDTTEIDKNTQVRLEKAIRSAIENAVEQKNIDLLVAYSTRSPEIAKSLRQNVVPLLVDALKEAFLNEQFDRLEQLNSTLVHTLAIEFSLERTLLQTFDTSLKEQKIAAQLSTDSIENLLQPQEAVAYDLGPKFTYLKNYFAKEAPAQEGTTDVINNILKGLVLDSSGKYGTPNALYRLNHAFNETDFNAEERHAYLISAMRTALERDLDLSAEDVIITGKKLLQQHEDITARFMINEALTRLDTIDQNKALWALLQQPEYHFFQETLQTEQPDFISLMQGITAYEQHDFASAIDDFGRISQPYYKQLAEPFAQHYLSERESFQGTYVAAPLVNKTSPIAMLVIGTPQNSMPVSGTLPNLDTLTNVYVSLINRIGTSQLQQNMLTSQGSVARNNYSATLNFTKHTVELKNPTSLATDRFGTIYALQRTGNGNMRLRPTPNGDAVTFKKISPDSQYNTRPNGRYSITTQIQGQTEDTKHMFPTGAQFDITTSPNKTVIAGTKLAVYPVHGTFTHPAAPAEKQPITGVYNPVTHLTSLQFDYLLPESIKTPEPAEGETISPTVVTPPKKQTVNAYARCQFFEENMLCAGHNAHNLRLQYHHLVQGTKIAETEETLPPPPAKP